MVHEFEVSVDKELEELIPGYLERLKETAHLIRDLSVQHDFDQIRTLGHNMKGSGGGYGFDIVSSIGKGIEETAREGNEDEIRAYCDELLTFLDNVKVSFVVM